MQTAPALGTLLPGRKPFPTWPDETPRKLVCAVTRYELPEQPEKVRARGPRVEQGPGQIYTTATITRCKMPPSKSYTVRSVCSKRTRGREMKASGLCGRSTCGMWKSESSLPARLSCVKAGRKVLSFWLVLKIKLSLTTRASSP